MNANKKSTIVMLGLLCSTWLSAAQPAQARTIDGTALLGQPIANSTIRVADLAGKVLLEKNNATDENGFFSVSVPDESTAVLKIEALGGEMAGVPFEGTLYGQTSAEADELLVHLNAGTTLVERYQQLEPQATRAQAETRVQQYLGLSDLVTLRSGIENPYLRIFSAQTLMAEAGKNGGLDRYTQELAIEMTKSADAMREFPAPVGLQSGSGSAIWIGEKLLAGIVGDVGSKLFNKFLSGIGFPSGNEQILGVLNQVLAEIGQIKTQLKEMETAIKQVNYDVRSSKLRDTYGEYIMIADKINELNKIALSNTNADGTAKDAAKTADIAATSKKYMQQIIDKDLKLVSNVHTEFTDSGDSTPLQKVFAEVKFNQATLIDKGYFQVVSEQVDQYRGYQAVVTTLLVDALRAQAGKDTVDAQAVLATALKYINEEKPIYPTHKLFTEQQFVTLIQQGRFFYQKNLNLLWLTGYIRHNSCADFNRNQANPDAEVRSPTYDEMVNLLDVTGLRGYAVKDYVQAVGYSKADAEAIKMITFGCGDRWSGRRYVTHYYWFGNDQQGPFSQYFDNETDYNRQKQLKGMGDGFWSMAVRTLR